MMGFPIKAEWLYDAVNTIRDWIKGTSNDKPKVEVSGEVEVDGSVTVKNFPETQKVSADEPLPVSINNSNTTLPVSINGNNATIKSAPVTGAKTITTTAAEIFAGASRLANRYQMTIQNVGTLIIYIGAAGVTADNGFPLLPGDSITLSFKPDVATPIYAISTGSCAVRVVELA
jgi:hypothetical protein